MAQPRLSPSAAPSASPWCRTQLFAESAAPSAGPSSSQCLSMPLSVSPSAGPASLRRRAPVRRLAPHQCISVQHQAAPSSSPSSPSGAPSSAPGSAQYFSSAGRVRRLVVNQLSRAPFLVRRLARPSACQYCAECWPRCRPSAGLVSASAGPSSLSQLPPSASPRCWSQLCSQCWSQCLS
jgi:hypothetical protein